MLKISLYIFIGFLMYILTKALMYVLTKTLVGVVLAIGSAMGSIIELIIDALNGKNKSENWG